MTTLDDRDTVKDPVTARLRAERPAPTVERKQALADLEHALFGRPRRVVTVSRYVLLRRIAAGGGGVVYSAYDPELDRKVALKLIRTRPAGADDSAEAAARLTREARAAAKLAHPNVVTVHDVGIYDPAELGVVAGTPEEELTEAIERELPACGVFVVMEFVVGQSLAEWAAAERRPWREVVGLYLQAGEGLAAAHACGLVHRDFKPSNVMVGADGRARVLDFGLARSHGESEAPAPVEGLPPAQLDRTLDPRRPLTREGAVLGTPAYMPPEQHAGEPADERSDQYGFCAALFDGLFGRPPFAGEDLESLERAKRAEQLVEVDADRAPAWLLRILRRGLKARPDERYPSVRALLDELARDPAQLRLRVGLGAALAAIVGGLVGALVWVRSHADAGCPDPAAPLVGVWDAARKSEIAAAFAGSGKPYASATWSSVETAIDDYAERWTAARREACEATLVRRERSPELMGAQILCLDSRLNRLAELTRLLATGDVQVIETATDGVAMLAPLEGCTDPSLAGSTLLPPIAARDQAMRIDADLARTDALRRAGKLDDATALVDEAVSRARELEHPPSIARALLLRGQVRSAARDGRAAESALREALLLAESSADDDTAVRALVELGYVVGLLHKRHSEAEQLLALARAKLARHNPGPHVEAMLARNQGVVLIDERRFDEAFAPLDLARTLLEDAYGADSVHVAAALGPLGLLALSRRDHAAAIEYHQRSLALLEQAVGPRHPSVAGIVANLGVIAMEQGDFARAEIFQRRALAILRESVGEDHPYVAQGLSNLAATLVSSGKLDEALAVQREALAIKRARLGPDDPSIAVSLNNLGAALNLAGRDREALALHEEALALRARVLGEDHPETAMSRTNIGLSYVALGRWSEAEELLSAVFAGLRDHFGDSDFRLAEPLRGLGEAELQLGAPARAREHLETALRLVDSPMVDPMQAADVRLALATAVEREDPARALELARAAADAYERLGEDNPRRQRALAFLGRQARAPRPR